MLTISDKLRYVRLFSLWNAVALLLAGCGAIPDGRSAPVRGSDSTTVSRAAPSASARACFNELGAANVRFSPLPDQRFSNGCSQIDAIRLIDIGAPVTNLGPVKCDLAKNFAGWTEYGVKRAAQQILNAELARIETFGSYSCRNIAGSRRLSQHAHANAIDVAAFVLTDGRRISVEDGWRGSAEEREFLAVVHKSACRRFGTVLSPDYNAAHRNHFHFDMSGDGYCR